MDKVTDTLTVYSNSEAAGDEDYSEYYQSSTAGVRDGITSVADGETIGTGDDAYTTNVLTFESDVSDISEEISVTAFRIGNDLEKTFMDEDETEDVNEREVEGSFNGIPGTYECTSDSCTISTDSDGEVDAFTTGTWTFTPTKAGAEMMVKGVIPDADFLTFGYWLQATEDDEGETDYGVRTFATGGTLYTLGNAQASGVQGTATYAGPATGLYVKKTFSDRGVGTPSASGQFTGDASLTAYFSGGDVTPNNSLSINGEVTNFRDGQGNIIDHMWTVELMKAGFAASGTNATKADLPNNTFGGDTTGNGEWQGQFFGMFVEDTDTTTDGNQSSFPTGVAGEFNGHFSNGHVIGAFGATQDE